MITAVITKSGRILQNKQVNGATITFTRVVAGTGNTPIEELQDKIGISSITQTLSIQSIKQNEREQSYTILVLLENTNLTKSYNLNQIGFYAKDPNDGEILFAIAQFDTPKKIEIPTVEPGYTLEMPFIFQNSNSANVEIELDPDNLMSRAGVEEILKSEEISGKANGNVIAVSDSAESPFLDFKLFGKSMQENTKGYQLFDYSKIETTSNGNAKVTNNGDGSFTVSGSGVIADTYDFGVNYVYSHEEAIALLGSAGTFRFLSNVTTRPYVYAVFLQNEESIGEINNRDTTNTSFKITDDVFNDETFRLRIGFYGFKSDTVKAGTVKPMFYKDGNGDGTFEKFTGCKAAPSPEYPQEVENTGDDGSVDLNVQGKNLWTVDTTNENLTYDEATQIMTINGAVNLTVHELPIPIPKGTTVTISAEVVSGVVTSSGDGGLAFGGYHKKDKVASWQGYINVPKCSVQDLTGQKYSQTVETTEEVTHFYAFVYESTASIHEPLKVKVQYEINNIATDYGPHKVSQMANILTPNGLHGIPVSEGGNYTDENGQEWICDEINLAKRKHIQRVGTAIIDGTKPFTKNNGTEYDNNFVYFTNKSNYGIDTLRYEGYCSHLSCFQSPSLGGMCLYMDGFSHVLYLDAAGFLDNDSSINTADNLATALGENQVEVKFILPTPIETDLTDEQIAAFESLSSYESTTSILMDSIGNMEVEYFKNTGNGKAMGILKSEHIYLKKLIGDVNEVVKGLVG